MSGEKNSLLTDQSTQRAIIDLIMLDQIDFPQMDPKFARSSLSLRIIAHPHFSHRLKPPVKRCPNKSSLALTRGQK